MGDAERAGAAGDGSMRPWATPIVCAICLYDGNPAPANEAVTIIEGTALCEDHLGFVPLDYRVVRAAKEAPIHRKPARASCEICGRPWSADQTGHFHG